MLRYLAYAVICIQSVPSESTKTTYDACCTWPADLLLFTIFGVQYLASKFHATSLNQWLHMAYRFVLLFAACLYLDSRFDVCCIFCPSSPVPGPRPQAPNARSQVPGPRFHAPGTRSQFLNIPRTRIDLQLPDKMPVGFGAPGGSQARKPPRPGAGPSAPDPRPRRRHPPRCDFILVRLTAKLAFRAPPLTEPLSCGTRAWPHSRAIYYTENNVLVCMMLTWEACDRPRAFRYSGMGGTAWYGMVCGIGCTCFRSRQKPRMLLMTLWLPVRVRLAQDDAFLSSDLAYTSSHRQGDGRGH